MHCPQQHARDYDWGGSRCVILAAEYASNGIYNFVVPLRAHVLPASSLRPIILLLAQAPAAAFIDAISWFPLVYWMKGNIDSLDDLIRAAVPLAEAVVVVNKEASNSAEEDHLADCNTIVAVQTMFKLFPQARIITELSQSSNMRFMQFRANDTYALSLSKMEKVNLRKLVFFANNTLIISDLARTRPRLSHFIHVPFAIRCRLSFQCLDVGHSAVSGIRQGLHDHHRTTAARH